MHNPRSPSPLVVTLTRRADQITVEAGSASWPFRPDAIDPALEFARATARLFGAKLVLALDEKQHRRAPPAAVKRRRRKRSDFASAIALSCGPRLARAYWPVRRAP